MRPGFLLTCLAPTGDINKLAKHPPVSASIGLKLAIIFRLSKQTVACSRADHEHNHSMTQHCAESGTKLEYYTSSHDMQTVAKTPSRLQTSDMCQAFKE